MKSKEQSQLEVQSSSKREQPTSSMRIPGLGRKKSSKNTNNDAQTTSADTSNSYSQSENGHGDTLSELGALPASRSSVDHGSGITSKRSIFRRGHSRSLSANAQSKLDLAESVRPIPATISVVSSSGGHPLRQQISPQDLQPVKAKRPSLFGRKSTRGSSPYSASSSVIPVQIPAVPKTSPPREVAPLASTSSESFQLRSFRATTGVREDQPTLSSLVDEEYVASPFSTRPNSPSPSPNPGSGSYFDNIPNAGSSAPAASGGHQRGFSSGSISVAKFREARAARSSSSLASADRSVSTGLKLDLPPPSSMESSRPVLASIQPVTTANVPVSPLSAASYPVSAPASSATFASAPSVPVMHPSFSDTHTTQMETLASPLQPPRSPRLADSLAWHPDNALPLPPVPSDPRRSFQSHSRRTSTQSITSLSSAFGGWLNNTTANLGIAFSVEDVQKAINSGATALKSSIPASAQRDKPFNTSLLEELQETLARPQASPSQEDIDELLGGKILPPPPSADDDLRPQNLAASTSHHLSRTSSLSNLSVSNGIASAKNLFSSSIARVAKPAKDHDDAASDTSVDLQATKPFGAIPPPEVHVTNSAKKKRLFGDSSSDEESSPDEDSDDSDVERKRRERGRVFPPPRPVTQQEREQVYKTAQSTPNMSPRGSQADLRHFAQVSLILTQCCL